MEIEPDVAVVLGLRVVWTPCGPSGGAGSVSTATVNKTERWSQMRSPGLWGFVVTQGSMLAGMLVVTGLLGGTDSGVLAWAAVSGTLLSILVATVMMARANRTGLSVVAGLVIPDRQAMSGGLKTLPLLLGALSTGILIDCLVKEPQSLSPIIYEAAQQPIFWVDALLLGPVAEELAYRGFLFDFVDRRWGGTVAIIVSGLSGAVVHWSMPQMISVLPNQLLFSYVRGRTGSLSLCVLLHVIYNCLATLAALVLAMVGH